LVDRLLKLDQDENEYFRHFWWKDVYKVIDFTCMIII
jgi:alpha-1,3-fucosyltransferase